MDVGTRLREARHQRGLTLDGIAASTRIPRPILEHLEHNRFGRLAGGIVTRGYLRACAAELGLDPEAIVRAYLAQCFGAAAEDLPIVRRPPLERETHPGRIFAVELIVVAIALVAYQALRGTPQPPRAGLPPRALSATEAEPLPGREPVALAVAADRRDAGVRIDIQPVGPCWVSATADGRLVISRELQRGDRAVAAAADELVLQIGDPETFVYWVNGRPGRTLGRAGKPVTVRITADNYEALAADSDADLDPLRLPVRVVS